MLQKHGIAAAGRLSIVAAAHPISMAPFPTSVRTFTEVDSQGLVRLEDRKINHVDRLPDSCWGAGSHGCAGKVGSGAVGQLAS